MHMVLQAFRALELIELPTTTVFPQYRPEYWNIKGISIPYNPFEVRSNWQELSSRPHRIVILLWTCSPILEFPVSLLFSIPLTSSKNSELLIALLTVRLGPPPFPHCLVPACGLPNLHSTSNNLVIPLADLVVGLELSHWCRRACRFCPNTLENETNLQPPSRTLPQALRGHPHILLASHRSMCSQTSIRRWMPMEATLGIERPSLTSRVKSIPMVKDLHLLQS
jgi:hypothetical protein